MGRWRAPVPQADDESQRSKRRRVASNGDNQDGGTSGNGDGKRSLYHCNYCNKDISGAVRIKCAKCHDFDLCIECFSVGAEITPHKSNHDYRVMDCLSFPLLDPEWSLDEENLLLEAIEMYGLSYWKEVAEHVVTKTKDQCYDHYQKIYMNSPCFPLPDMSHVNGKTKTELMSIAKELGESKKGEITDNKPNNANYSTMGKPGTKIVQVKEESNVVQTVAEDPLQNRSVGGKKPRASGEDGPSLLELSGYNPKRQEFDPEYDNDAEAVLAEMEFKENDTDMDRELKLRMLRIYLSRLDERKRRKEFILERNLLYTRPEESTYTKDEKELCQRFRVFMRYHSQKDHDELLDGLIRERKLRQKIEELQEYRAAGCRTVAEAEQYAEEKRKRDAEATNKKQKESSQAVAAKLGQRGNRSSNREREDASPGGIVDSQKGNQTGQKGLTKNIPWDITGLPGVQMLSSTERELCIQNRLHPAQYLKIKEELILECLKGCPLKRSDAHIRFKLDPIKIDKVYDFLLKRKLIQERVDES